MEMQDLTSHFSDWPEPLPFEEVPLQPWPSNVFPEPFQTFVNELTRSTETPIGLAAMLTLSVTATAAHKRFQVQIKSDYIEPVNIWTVTILPPASRKSRVYNEVTAPLRKWECEQKELLEPQIKIAESKQKTCEARLKELRNMAAKADENKYVSLQDSIERLEAEQNSIPKCPQIWTGDVTPEHLGTIMAANDEAMATLSDEGGIFDILGGLYSDGKANIDLLLQAHAASPVRVDRGSRPPIFMQRPVLTMGLTVQPEVIRNICRNKTFRGRGLLGRFLYAMPKSNIGTRSFTEAPMNEGVVLNYRNALKSILNQPDYFEEGIKTQYILKMTHEAYEKWLSYAKTLEALMGDDIGHLSHITDWAGKLPGAIARIAALIHIMRYAHQNPWEYPISLDDMASAVKIGHVLTNHALSVFDLLQQDGAQEIAKTIYQWIKRRKLQVFTRRELQRDFRRFKKEDVLPAFEILKERVLVREVEGNGKGKGVYIANPRIFV